MWVIASAAALPLLACFVRKPERGAWLVAAAFAVSLVIDVVSDQVRAPGGHGNAWVGYLGYPVQFALLVLAVAKDWPAIWIGLGAVVVIAMGSSAVPVSITISGQEIVVPQETMLRGLAGIGVAIMAWVNPLLDRVRGPVMLYAAGCLPFIIAMGLLPRTLESGWVSALWGYSAVALAAQLWMAGHLLRGDRTLRHASEFPHARQVNRSPAGAA